MSGGYIGINNKAKKIKSLYIGVNNKARKVNSAYIGISNKARKWYPGDFPPGPNDQYEETPLGRWDTTSRVDDFFNTYKPDNGWKGLKLGNYVQIWPTGTTGFGVEYWEIAGFNMEHNQKAADGTTYDNGYGICMIPKTTFQVERTWNDEENDGYGYAYSTMHTMHMSNLSGALRGLLGSHLINRNVLLSNWCDGTYPRDGTSSSYSWTTAYCTLMSVGQVTGTFASHNNKYDDGEANYKLPLFNFENYYATSYWTRNVWGGGAGEQYEYSQNAYAVSSYHSGIIERYVCTIDGVRPMIYLR